MRKGFDVLYGLVRDRLSCDPLSGHVFLFSNSQRNRLKLIVWEGSGLWVCSKRLSKGRFVWWPEDSVAAKPLEAYEAQLLMAAGDLSRVRAAPMWRRVNALK